jgi:hypothetical protein
LKKTASHLMGAAISYSVKLFNSPGLKTIVSSAHSRTSEKAFVDPTSRTGRLLNGKENG